jgi:hypothetical protein
MLLATASSNDRLSKVPRFWNINCNTTFSAHYLYNILHTHGRVGSITILSRCLVNLMILSETHVPSIPSVSPGSAYSQAPVS